MQNFITIFWVYSKHKKNGDTGINGMPYKFCYDLDNERYFVSSYPHVIKNNYIIIL